MFENKRKIIVAFYGNLRSC